MQFAVEVEILDNFGSVGLEGAAVVVDVHPRHLADQRIGDPRGQQAGQCGVLTLLAPAAHQVVALF